MSFMKSMFGDAPIKGEGMRVDYDLAQTAFPMTLNLSWDRKSVTGHEDTPTETLRNLWLVKFGDRAVTLNDMYELRHEPIKDIAQELANRKLVTQQKTHRMDTDMVMYHYVLGKEDGNH